MFARTYTTAWLLKLRNCRILSIGKSGLKIKFFSIFQFSNNIFKLGIITNEFIYYSQRIMAVTTIRIKEYDRNQEISIKVCTLS